MKGEIIINTREFSKGTVVDVLEIKEDGAFKAALVEYNQNQVWIFLNELKIL